MLGWLRRLQTASTAPEDLGLRMHEVRVLCFCDNVEQCQTETYVSDVRIAHAEIEALKVKRSRGV